jgi:hypothetical protein
MKTYAAILVPLLCAGAGAPSEIDGLIDGARGAPAEFAADAMIRIAALDKVPKAQKIELLGAAFQRASGAQQPYKRRASIVRADSTGGFFNRVYAQDLDALSLELRAIEGMLPLDGRKARDLFLQIPPLRIPPLKCDDFMVYDVDRFYGVLGSVARETFTAKQVQEREPFRLLEQYAGAITSPVQVGPVARLLAAASVKDEDFQSLATFFAGALRKISGDDRSFTYAAAVGAQVLALVEECKRRKSSPLPLVEGYRLYLVNHFSASRCADDDLMQNTGASFGMATGQAVDAQSVGAVVFFNQKLQMAPLQPIQEQEATPSRLEGAATGLRSCEEAECRAIVQQYRALIFNSSGSPYAAAEKDRPEWRNRLQDFLGAMVAWKESASATAAAHFRDKCGIYSELSSVVAPGPERERVLRALLDYVKQNRFQAENRMEWFLPVNTLIGRASLDPLGLGRLMDELRRVNDPVIALYANLEAAAPRGAARILPLL